MQILHLTLKKKWFDMIISGEKKEEYRDLKFYWADRLMTGFPSTYGYIDKLNPDFKHFDIIRFKNGYSKDAPSVDVVCKGIRIGNNGKPEWGFNKECFIIELGCVKKEINNIKLTHTSLLENGTYGIGYVII